MTKKKNEGIRQQIEDKEIPYEIMPKDSYYFFLHDINEEIPDDLEIFTTDKGWHKINKNGR